MVRSATDRSAALPKPNASRRKEHDAILGAIPTPKWLVSGSLLDDVYEVRTADPDKLKRSTFKTRFDAPIALYSRLNDPIYEKDLITAKLLLITAMSDSQTYINNASGASLFVRNYTMFVRWRLGQSVWRNQNLTSDFLRLMFSSIKESGIVGLMPIAENWNILRQDLHSGKVAMPFTERHGGRYLSMMAIAELLGVPHSTALPISIVKETVEMAKRSGLDIHRQGSTAAFADSVPEDTSADGSSSDARWEPVGDIELDAPSVAGNRDENTTGTDEGLRGNAQTRIAGFLRPIALLWEFRTQLAHDPIQFDPLGGGKSCMGLAAELATRPTGRTKTIPALQVCSLINAALEWVIDYSWDIRRLIAEVQEETTRFRTESHWSPHGAAIARIAERFEPNHRTTRDGFWFPFHPSYFPPSRIAPSRPSIRTIVFDHLVVACVIVVAAFSARRHEEIASLRSGCISEDDGNLWLESYIEKTLLDLEKIPVPRSVALAIDVLSWLSETRRTRKGSKWLFDFDEIVHIDQEGSRDPGTGDRDFYRGLSRFSTFVGTPLLDDGTEWVPLPHQFRRFFGVVYFHRFRFPHLTALSNFYRHFDPDVTRRYIIEAKFGGFLRQADIQAANDKQRRKVLARAEERLEDFKEAGKEFRVERYVNTLRGSEKMTGFGGEFLSARLKQLEAAFRNDLQVNDEDPLDQNNLIEIALSLAGETQIVPNGLGHSSCKCTANPTDLSAANCLNQEGSQASERSFGAPDPAHAADVVCGECPHNVQFPEYHAYWLVELARSRESLACPLSAIQQAFEQKRLARLEKIANRCHST